MKLTRRSSVIALFLWTLAALWGPAADNPAEVKEKPFEAPYGLTIMERMEGPTTADVPLQVVCYFKYTPELAKKMTGAPVELDKELGGVIGSLRERGEFAGDEGETLLLMPPKDSIKPKALLLVGLGDEKDLSLQTLERVGRIAFREAARLGDKRIAYAPLIRDQGNSKFNTGEIADAFVRGFLLAHDTDKRLQKEGLAKEFTVEQLNIEAGPAFFDDTAKGLQKGIDEAKADIAKRPKTPYIGSKK
jgi:leucyl aminopeptidase